MKSAKHIPTLLRPTLSAFAAVGMLISIVGEVSAQEIGACLKDGKLDQVTVGGVPTCKDNETPIVWNQAGPQGPQGEPGPAGPASVINRHLFVITGQYEVPVGYADYHLLLTLTFLTIQPGQCNSEVLCTVPRVLPTPSP
jgi:hypothetical protein